MKKVLLIPLIALLVITLGTTTMTAQDATQKPALGAATGKAAVPATPPTAFNLGLDIKNPLKVDTIQDAVKFFVTTIVKIAIPLIVISFIWSGLSFIFAQGRPESVKKAKNIFFNTVIGTLLILGAWTITNAIVGTVNSIAN